MKNRMRMMSVLGASVLAVPLFGARPAAAGGPSLAGCAAGIQKQAVAAEAGVLKALQACDAQYRKDLAKPETQKGCGASPAPACINFVNAGKTCEKALGKAVFLAQTGGALGKAKLKLDGLVPGTCTDASLLTLGHLPQGKFGDLWSRYIAMASLNKAYQQEIELARDTINMLQALAGGGQCPTCVKLQTAPCWEHACVYDSAGISKFSDVADALGGLNIAGDLVGASTFTLCQFGDINPDKDYLVTGATSKGIQAAPIVVNGNTIAYACPLTIGAEGYINCGGSSKAVNYHSCQDSLPSDCTDATKPCTDSAGACQAAITPDVCSAPAIDTDIGPGWNGGACFAFDTAPGSSGVAYINNTTQLNTPQPTQLGGDGVACTGDDTVAPAAPATIPLTTGSADSVVLNTPIGGSDGQSNGPVSGLPFTCANITSSNLSGAKIAGAFPTVSQPTTNDNAVTFFIKCQ